VLNSQLSPSNGVTCMVKVYVKVHRSGDAVIVAVCDEGLLGKTLAENTIKFKVSEDFYGGDLVDINEAIKLIKSAYVANLVGKNIVEAAIRANLVLRESIIYIDGVPHAQVINYE